MIDERFLAASPWSVPLPPLGLPIGMLSDAESSLFHHLAKDVYRGQGAIVDAGSFLGRSAHCFATGLRANARFDPARHRIHCFDNFRVNESGTVDFLRHCFGQTRQIGDSTRDLFDRQTGAVRDLLEVHEGDFHTVSWQRQPIEILMVDIAKSISLGQRVVDLLFRDLIPGVSIVIHQDYHHAWLPHIHVVMEHLSPWFRIVIPRVWESAVFESIAPIPEAALQRAIAYDFSPAEQRELMDRALQRFPEELRERSELARITLLTQVAKADAMPEFEALLRQHAGRTDAPWLGYVASMRATVESADGWAAVESGDWARALLRGDSLLAGGAYTPANLALRGAGLEGLGRLDAAELQLREALVMDPNHGHIAVRLARLLLRRARGDEAETLLACTAAAGPRPGMPFCNLLDQLLEVWRQRPKTRPERAKLVIAALLRALPGHPEVLALEARMLNLYGAHREAAERLQLAAQHGLPRARFVDILRQHGLTPEQFAADHQ